MAESTSEYYKSNYAARKRRREQQRRYNKTKKGLKIRVAANAANRAKGTYGNGDGLDDRMDHLINDGTEISVIHLLNSKPTDNLMDEFSGYDKDLRQLTYRVLLEKFNSKYDGLSEDQKTVLKEFINSVDSTPGLRNFYNTKINELRDSLKLVIKKIKDKTTQIKLNEVSKFLVEFILIYLRA